MQTPTEPRRRRCACQRQRSSFARAKASASPRGHQAARSHRDGRRFRFGHASQELHSMRRFALFAMSCLAAACGSRSGPGGGPPVPAAALSAMDTATLMQHIRVLSADSLLGRAPGSVGEEKTVRYLEAQFKAIGLKPGNTDGTYIQKVP